MTEPSQLFQVIVDKYKSLESPDFHWVIKEHERKPYRGLEQCLMSRFSVEDITDLNNDVSCVLAISPEGSGVQWTLKISLVGPYAVLLRETGARGWDVYVQAESDARSEDEYWILEACRQHAIEVLRLDVLKTPIGLRLFDTDPERVRLYQALFSDNDYLPGEYDAEHGA
ncbi:hypothetical protein WME75_36180 [Sorangium sp. So ce1014]|uniref:hypothetical protein n=1 Tax=Sorangium sp. So ce1014 TaxID=3133326 RepID=UPI003F62E755